MGKVLGIEAAVLDALADLEPRHGGQMVAQAETQTGRVFRRSAGWALELCAGEDRLHIQLVGSSVYRCAELELFRYAGDERVTPEEMAAAADADMRQEQERRLIASALEHAIERMQDYEDAPEITVAAE